MKRFVLALVLAASCGGSKKAPPPVPSITLPAGADLKPFDPAKPSLARPAGMTFFNGKAWVALANYDDQYVVRGPGLLGVLDPTSGAKTVVDLGGSTGRQCLEAYWIREDGGKLYVTCTGDAFNTGDGEAILEVDPSTAKVTRAVTVPTSPSGLAITPSRIWFGDAFTGNVYAIDRSTFTLVAGPLPIACPSTGTYVTTNEVIYVHGDVYAACSNDTGGILSRLDSASGALKGQADSGPTAVEFTQTGDGRIAIVSGADNKLRLVTIGTSTLTVAEAYTYSSTTETLQDVHARGQFLFTAASGSNTVQKLDLTKSGAQMLVGEANVGIGAAPWTIVPLDDDQALVANQTANTVVSVGADCTGGKLCWSKPQ